jgi:hypothetical protein
MFPNAIQQEDSPTRHGDFRAPIDPVIIAFAVFCETVRNSDQDIASTASERVQLSVRIEEAILGREHSSYNQSHSEGNCRSRVQEAATDNCLNHKDQ